MRQRSPFLYTLSKVPEVSIYFWVTKILTTGMGETASDFFARRLGPIPAVLLGALFLTAALALQLSVHKYKAWIYWLAVVMVSVFGTMFADVLHVGFGIPYIVSTIFFVITLGILFILWHWSEGSLSIHSVTTRKREGFYWATVFTTFALGTAVGDMTATTMHLGYFSSGILFAVLFAIPALAYWLFKINEILAFWCAYIITRPFGASFADWVGVSNARGGLGWGTGSISLLLSIFILALVYYLTVTHKDVEGELITPQFSSRL